MIETSDIPMPDAQPSDEYLGRVVAITGVGRAGQVGEALAAAFAHAGASVALVDRDEAELGARAAELRELYPERDITAHTCDLTDPDSVSQMVDAVRAAHGESLHALVNAAGGFGASGEVALSDPALWHRMFAINLTTAYLATRAFLPSLREGGGAICYFGSVAAMPGANGANISAYTAAKSGVLSLMQSVAAEERANGVRANAIAPVAVRTRENEQSMGVDAEYVEREDVSRLVLFLCSPVHGRVITGQVIRAG